MNAGISRAAVGFDFTVVGSERLETGCGGGLTFFVGIFTGLDRNDDVEDFDVGVGVCADRWGDLDRCLKGDLEEEFVRSFFSLINEEEGGEKDLATIMMELICDVNIAIA